jgi:hypothetical protein
MDPNYTSSNISRQISNQSGQVALSSSQGSLQWTDTITGKALPTQPADSSLLSISSSSKINLNAKNLQQAAGLYAKPGVPQELVQIVAATAAYATKTSGIPITDLVTSSGVSSKFLGVYNSLAPRTAQIGLIVSSNAQSNWHNNPTLRGSIAAAGDQP